MGVQKRNREWEREEERRVTAEGSEIGRQRELGVNDFILFGNTVDLVPDSTGRLPADHRRPLLTQRKFIHTRSQPCKLRLSHATLIGGECGITSGAEIVKVPCASTPTCR